MNKEILIKEIGNWFGDYIFEDGKYKINNGEEVFEYSSADECLFDWLPTLVESDEDTGENMWADAIEFINNNCKVYLTRYDEYPIYEPAEGGYYYPGRDVEEYYECDSIKEAKQKLLEMKDELEENGFRVWEDGAYLSSKYIGDGIEFIIEARPGSHTRGRVPYC